jgi:hypothetical protein
VEKKNLPQFSSARRGLSVRYARFVRLRDAFFLVFAADLAVSLEWLG